MEDVKQVIVIRKDLKMRSGKIGSQTAHASMKVFFDQASISKNKMTIDLTEPMKIWSEGAFAKIVVYVNSEAELLEIYQKALAANLPCSLIIDAGRTEFHGVATKTAVAVGPDYVSKIDKITGSLPLM